MALNIDDYLPKPYKKNFVLADNTVMYGTAGLTSDGEHLWLWPDDLDSIVEAMMIFNDPNKTSRITMNNSPYEKTVFEGFTKLMVVQTTGSGKISVKLDKATSETVSQE